ncbi:hypothetical protein [Candidatus Hodgkinia cicadicola]
MCNWYVGWDWEVKMGLWDGVMRFDGGDVWMFGCWEVKRMELRG